VLKKSNVKDRQASSPTFQQKNDPKSLIGLQKIAGNKAVQRLIIQGQSSGSSELDDETINRINQERGQGQSLDSTVQTQMSQALGMNFGHVDVHTSPESDSLNRQLNAKAFTTGKDIFFREGEYQPHSSSGQSLIAHELSHVVQQSTGQVPTSNTMQVNPPDDAFEKQADSFAQNLTMSANAHGIQRQEEEEEEPVQAQEMDEEEEVQTMSLQKQETPEEEEEV
jgi:hypothetical protein